MPDGPREPAPADRPVFPTDAAEHGHVPPPVERIAAEELLDGVNRAAGAGLRLIGSAGHGEVGAAYVSWPDGRRC